MTAKEFSTIATSWLTIILLVFAGLVAWRQYFETIRTDKSSKTLSFVTIYNSDPVLKSRFALDSAVQSAGDKVIAIINQQGKPLPEIQSDLDNMYVGLIHDKLDQEANTVFDILEEMAACVNLEVCDGVSAKSFFWRTSSGGNIHCGHTWRNVD
jgi:hypothetical protein